MSANKTIKALREERIKNLTEIARLRAVAGEQAPHRDAVRDMRLGILPFKSPAEVAAMMKQFSREAAGIQAPVHMLLGHESDEAMRSHLATLERQYLCEIAPSEPPYVQVHLSRGAESLAYRIDIRTDVTLVEVYDASSAALAPYASRAVMPAEAESPRGGGKCQDVPYFDWHEAPEGTTHALMRNPSIIVWLKLGTDHERAQQWSRSTGAWLDGGCLSWHHRQRACVFARPVPEEVWSVDGLDGSWSYPTLAALLRDNYGSETDGTSFGPGLGNGLAVGAIVHRAIVCKDDPATFLPDTDYITSHMCDMAYQSDAGEWADGYPELDSEALQAMDKALEPLKGWARRYCQPDFFTVKDITTHELTEEDVRAARLEVSQCSG